MRASGTAHYDFLVSFNSFEMWLNAFLQDISWPKQLVANYKILHYNKLL